METQQIYTKLNHIEQQIEKIKILLAMHMHKKKKKVVSLKGILKGIEITEEDIEEAKRSIFKIK